MNLHAIAGPIIAAINPMITATWQQSDGTYSTSASGKRTPNYTTVGNVQLQVQALTARDLTHLDGLNIQNVTRKVWVNSSLQGVNRTTQQGGDLLIFNGQTWLVTIVFETWDSDGPWSSAGLTLQQS